MEASITTEHENGVTWGSKCGDATVNMWPSRGEVGVVLGQMNFEPNLEVSSGAFLGSG